MNKDRAKKSFVVYNFYSDSFVRTPKRTFDKFIDNIYDSFKTKTCDNCKHCDEVKDSIIHCVKFEEYLPKDIGGLQ